MCIFVVFLFGAKAYLLIYGNAWLLPAPSRVVKITMWPFGFSFRSPSPPPERFARRHADWQRSGAGLGVLGREQLRACLVAQPDALFQ